jgi:DNA-directed RNA polymerase subunit RPC12/RpoP
MKNNYNCPICGKVFLQLEVDKDYKCDKCGNTFHTQVSNETLSGGQVFLKLLIIGISIAVILWVWL